MIQLHILTGKKAGQIFLARHFPFRLGRLEFNDVALEEPGIWDHHFEIRPEQDGFVLQADERASVTIGAEKVQQTVLKNGDIIEIGMTKLRFSLAAPRQYSLVAREWMTWIGLGLACLSQVVLIYWLLQ